MSRQPALPVGPRNLLTVRKTDVMPFVLSSRVSRGHVIRSPYPDSICLSHWDLGTRGNYCSSSSQSLNTAILICYCSLSFRSTLPWPVCLSCNPTRLRLLSCISCGMPRKKTGWSISRDWIWQDSVLIKSIRQCSPGSMYCVPDHKDPLEFGSTDYNGPLDRHFYQELTGAVVQRQK